MNPTITFVTAAIGGVAAIIIGILGLTDPPILALGNASFLFIVGGFAVLGVPLNTGLQAARSATAEKAAEKAAGEQG